MNNKKSSPIGVLLINLGTPESTNIRVIREYLRKFLSDKRVIDYPSWIWWPILHGIILNIRPKKLVHPYNSIWMKNIDKSPLLHYTDSLSRKISYLLQKHSENTHVSYAMSYSSPYIKDALHDLYHKKKCKKIITMALYPQYSFTTTLAAYDQVFDYLRTTKNVISIRNTLSWESEENYINLLADSLYKHIDAIDYNPDGILVSFHGIPKRYVENGDPYEECCKKTFISLKKKFPSCNYNFFLSFQSRIGYEKWLLPYTSDIIKDLPKKGVKKLVAICPSFICDCLETLEEINIRAKEDFFQAGGKSFSCVPCLNDQYENAKFLSNILKSELKGWI